MNPPQIGILHRDIIDESFFNDFSLEIDHPDLNLNIKAMPALGPFACAEWFIPTVIAAFVGKAYFEEFFKEMGREHYQILKQALIKLTKKSINQPRLEPTLMTTSGKVNQNNPYSMAFSIMAEANDGYRFKLLLPKYTEKFSYDLAVAMFMEFIADYHLLGVNSKAHHEILKSGMKAGIILVRLNIETNEIEWQDSIPPEVRARMIDRSTT